MSSLKKIEEEYDIKILEFLNLEVKEYRKLKKIKAKIGKRNIRKILCKRYA